MWDTQYRNPLDTEIILITTATVQNLILLHPDSLTLYMFYTYIAKLQLQKNYLPPGTIRSTEEYSRKYLKWGELRFRRARGILKKNGYISNIVARRNGEITAHYVRLNAIPHQSDEQIEEVDEFPKEVIESKPQIKKEEVIVERPQDRPCTLKDNCGRCAKCSLVPCSRVELWQIIQDLRIDPKFVREKHRGLLELIETGEFQKKYKHKTVYYTLRKWLRLTAEKYPHVKLSEDAAGYYCRKSPQQMVDDEDFAEQLRKSGF